MLYSTLPCNSSFFNFGWGGPREWGCEIYKFERYIYIGRGNLVVVAAVLLWGGVWDTELSKNDLLALEGVSVRFGLSYC